MEDSRRHPKHDGLLDRTASLIISVIGNVLDVSLHPECEKLVVAHEFQEPFGEDITDNLNNIIKSVDAGIMATETAIELNPLIKDHSVELKRIKEEENERQERQQSIFDGNDGEPGAQTYPDGSADR